VKGRERILGFIILRLYAELVGGRAVQLLREGFSERLFLLHDRHKGLIVRKQAKPEIRGTLQAEIDWLQEVPPHLRDYFPRVLRLGKNQQEGNALFYEMPYFDHEWLPLSEPILTGALNYTQSFALIAQVMQVMFEGIFPMTYPEDGEQYVDQLVALIEQSVRRTAQLPAFASLIFSDTIVLNGCEQWNVFPLLERLKSEDVLRKALGPAVIRKVHGDLYPENVLLHLPSLRRVTPRVMLIDPVAAIGLNRGDFAMDIAKFQSWLSAELLTVRLGLFSIEKRPGAPVSFSMALHTREPQVQMLQDGALLEEFTRLVDSAAWAQRICHEDRHWRQRVSFYEALYALSMVPLVPPWQSLARFLVGLRHLNQFVACVDEQQSVKWPHGRAMHAVMA
jgi:hypothetical protein